MASIKYNEKKKYYEVRYDAGYDGQGKRIQKYKGGFKRKSDAEAFLADVLNSINQGTYIEPQNILLFQYLNEWLETRKDELSPTTYSGYEVNIRCHINPMIGGIKLQDLRPQHIRSLYNKLKKERILKVDGVQRKFEPLSNKSILYVHRVLAKALKDAYDDELIKTNPADKVKPPSPDKPETNFLTIEQIREMLDKFKNDEMYMPVLLAVTLGLRRGEILGLQWEDIDFDNKIIHVRHNYTMAEGKPILLDSPKTKSSNRDIIVTDRIIKELENHRLEQKKMKLMLGKKYNNNDFVCTWPNGEPFNPSHLSRAFKMRMKKYGLPEITFHELRHSNASLMLSQNVPMKAVSDRLGHSTITITNDIYGHIENSVQKQVAESIDKAIWG